MVVIYVRVSYLCGVISNISRMRNAINSAQLNKSGVITAAGKQMHLLSKRGSVFTLSRNEWHEREYIALYDKQRHAAFMTYEMWYIFKKQCRCSCRGEYERRNRK